MASRTETHRVLIGGVQYLPPTDKLAEGSSIQMRNFRTDQNGKLVSRPGSSKRAGPVGSERFHTFARNGNDEYAGIGDSILYGFALDQTLDSGYDGSPVGTAFYQRAGWFMNRARRKRFNGTSVSNWGVDAPQTAPIAAGGGQLSTLIEEWEGGAISVGVNSPTDGAAFGSYAMQGGAPVENDLAEASFDATNAKSGSALKIDILGPTSVSAFTDIGASLAVDGQTKDEDVIRVWVYCSNPKAVQGVTVFVRSSSGYVEYAFNNPDKWLSQSLNSWTQLKIRRRLNLDDWAQRVTAATKDGNQQTISDIEAQFASNIATPTFIYTGSGWPQTGIGAAPPSSYPPSQEMLALNWNSVTQFGVSFKVSEACTVAVDRAEVISTVGEDSTGAISYYVSYVNIYGEDSNPSPVSNAVIAGNQTITLSGIPTSTDPDVTQRWIYRIGGGLTQAYRVGILYDNATTSWEDHTTNRIAQRDNKVMPADRDLPPFARGVIGPIFGKLIAFSTEERRSRYFWTKAGQPWFFPGANDDAVGNWQDAGPEDDEIIAATDHRPILVLYKQRSIWRIVGDPEDEDPDRTSSDVGLVGPNAVVRAGGVDYFVGEEGVYLFNMSSAEKISQALDPIFKGDYYQTEDGQTVPPVTQDKDVLEKTCIAIVGDRLKVSIAQHGYSEPNMVLVCHLPTLRWAVETYDNLAAPAFTVMLNEGQKRGFYGGITGSDGGYLYLLEARGFHLDDDQPATATWQSRYLDMGLPANFKIFTDLQVDFETRFGSYPNSPLTVSILYDNGTKVQLGTISSATSDKPKATEVFRLMATDGVNVGRKALNASVMIEGDLYGPVTIHGVYLRWYPEERVARSFDSGITNFDQPERVKQVDHVEMYLTGSGQGLRRRFDSDLPGRVLTNRESVTFTAPAGRGTYRKRLGTVVEGRNFRLTVDESVSGSTFQVHQMRARMRVIGEYIDGTNGEYYESPEFQIEPGRVGELKDFLLDYDVSGVGGYIEVYSDLPGNALAIRKQIALPVRDRAPYVFAFEDPTITGPYDFQTALPYGQLFKVRIYPPPGGILRLHGRAQFRARVIGTYFDGTQGEIWESQPQDLLSGMGIFREVEATALTEGPMTLEMLTEIPGSNLVVSGRLAVDTSATTAGRLTISGRLPGNCKGHLQQFRLVGPYVSRLFRVRVLGRKTQLSDSPWTWLDVPLDGTGDQWANISMPVRNTPESFEWVDLPVDVIE